MLLCSTALCSGLCALVAIGGGPIQTAQQLPPQYELSFLGLLGGREIALTLRQRSTENDHHSTNAMDHLSKNLSQDIWEAGVGLIMSLTIGLEIQPLISFTTSSQATGIKQRTQAEMLFTHKPTIT